MFATNFSAVDWVIVAVYLIGIGFLGMYVNRHVHNAADYLVGGRGSGAALSVASFIGTGLGLVTLMYASMEGFNRGFAYLFVPILGMVVPLVLGATGFVIVRLREMGLTTIPEFYSHRYNRRVRVTGGIICALAGILNMGLFPKMGATFLTYATGLADGVENAEVIVNVITTVLIVMVLAYTVLGGMVAVLVTDYIQFVILSLGLGLGLIYCLIGTELGWEKIVQTMIDHKGEAAFNPVDKDSYGWMFVIWQICLVSTAAVCWIPEATRALTTKDPKTTRRTFFLGSPGFFARMAIPAVWGIAAFCFVKNHPQLAEYFSSEHLANEPGRALHAMPLLIGKLLPTCVLGLLVAGLMAAFMSTHDSYLLAWGSVISQDVIGPLTRRRKLTDRESILYTRVCVVLIGLFLLVWGIWYELPESVWTYMGVTGTVYLSGGATALIGGMYWSRASSTGALCAMLGGLLAIPTLFIGRLQHFVAGVPYDSSGAAPPLDAAGEFALKRVEVWLNDYSSSLAVYVLCVVLFVAGSLCFPDRPGEHQEASTGEPT